MYALLVEAEILMRMPMKFKILTGSLRFGIRSKDLTTSKAILLVHVRFRYYP